MIRIRQLKVLVGSNNLYNNIAKKLHIKTSEVKDITIVKKSIDSRCKPNNYYVYEVDINVDNEDIILKKVGNEDIFKTPIENYVFNPKGINKLNIN